MAVMGADGKRYHSASRAKLHEEVAAKKNNMAPMKKPAAESGPPAPSHGAGEADLSHMNMKDVVAKHGPAHKVEIEHDHAGGKHNVTSHHKGGHHKSSHGSADEAHMHAAHAADVQTPDNMEEEKDSTPFGGEETPAEEQAEGAAIPGVG